MRCKEYNEQKQALNAFMNRVCKAVKGIASNKGWINEQQEVWSNFEAKYKNKIINKFLENQGKITINSLELPKMLDKCAKAKINA